MQTRINENFVLQQNYAYTTYPKVLKYMCVRERNPIMTHDIYDNPHHKNYCSENFDWWAILRKSHVHIEKILSPH